MDAYTFIDYAIQQQLWRMAAAAAVVTAVATATAFVATQRTVSQVTHKHNRQDSKPRAKC